MTPKNEKLIKLLELANHYPSPHNGQPIRVEESGDTEFELYFELDRGLQATEISFLFSYVTMGVFMEHLELCAQALGHTITHRLTLPSLELMKGQGDVLFAQCSIAYDIHQPDEGVKQTILFRQTSRKKYSAGIDSSISDQTIKLASGMGMELVKMDRPGGHQAIWLNQRAVFDDMFDDDVRKELNHWLRYNKAEKEAKMDGLSYDCMEINGRTLKFIVQHYKILRMKGIDWCLKRYYLRTMSDDSDVYYMRTPFSTEKEAYDVGVALMKIWYLLAAQGYYLHPFGTIMSNQAAHRDFLTLIGVQHEDRQKNFLVFIYRAGSSEPPTRSLRLPIEQHLIKKYKR